MKIENLSKKDLNEYDPIKDKDVVIWSKDRKLTWDDFLVVQDPNDIHLALTNSIVYQKADPVIKKEGDQFVFTLGNIKTYALFRKSGSWVKEEILSSSKKDVILEHEQGHFDIREIFRQKFDNELQKESKKIRLCGGRNLSEAQANANKKIEKILRNIGRIVNTKRDQYNQKYEDETAHGERTEVQKKYTEEIQKLLDNL